MVSSHRMGRSRRETSSGGGSIQARSFEAERRLEGVFMLRQAIKPQAKAPIAPCARPRARASGMGNAMADARLAALRAAVAAAICHRRSSVHRGVAPRGCCRRHCRRRSYGGGACALRQPAPRAIAARCLRCGRLGGGEWLAAARKPPLPPPPNRARSRWAWMGRARAPSADAAGKGRRNLAHLPTAVRALGQSYVYTGEMVVNPVGGLPFFAF